MQQHRTLYEALWRLYEHSGFAMAGAVAFAFIVSLFPFCIFLGSLAGLFGGRELAAEAVKQLFEILPATVAQGLAPQVESIMGQTRIDLLTVGGFIALFFATSAIETLRAALNGAYRVRDALISAVSAARCCSCSSALSRCCPDLGHRGHPGAAARLEPTSRRLSDGSGNATRWPPP
jgi:uncharacterized BrkB/YihY/UPF0761 family membrane protein